MNIANNNIILESQESKSIDAAKTLYMQQMGCSREKADKFVITESSGISDIVLSTAREIVDKILYYQENGGCESYAKGDGFINMAFGLDNVGFIGDLWVNAVWYANQEEVDSMDFSAQVPFYGLEELTVEDGLLYHVGKYDFQKSLHLEVNYSSPKTLLAYIVHEVKHLYHSYLSKLKGIKQDKHYKTAIRNSATKIGTMLYCSNIDEIQAYTQDYYIQLKNGVDVKNTNLYDLYDFLSNYQLTDDEVMRFRYMSNLKDSFERAKKYLENRLAKALKVIKRNLNRVYNKVMNESANKSHGLLNEINHIASKSNITIASLNDFKHIVSSLGIDDNNVEEYMGEYCFIEIGSSLSRWREEIKHVHPMYDENNTPYNGDDFYNKGQWYFKEEHPNVIKLIFDDNQKFNNKTKPSTDGKGTVQVTPVKLSASENIYNKHGFCFYYENGEDFTDDKAAKLKSFVEDNLNANEQVKFIIHCMQGKSRSAAVGSYIANKIGQFNDDFLSEYDIDDTTSQLNIGISTQKQPKYPHKNTMTKMGELEGWNNPKQKNDTKEQWFYNTIINHPKTGYMTQKDKKMTESTKRRIYITESQLRKLIDEDVYISNKNADSKKALLKYNKHITPRQKNYGNLKPMDKLGTEKMDTNGSDTYEIPLKNGLTSYNITSINGSEVMHYFKRIFDKQKTLVKFANDDNDYELEMEDSEFNNFMTQFKNKVSYVVKSAASQFMHDNLDVDFTNISIYPVPSSSHFNIEMAKRLQYLKIFGLTPSIVDSKILRKDLSNLELDKDFIEKNKDYYDSKLNAVFKDKTHLDNVNTTKNKLEAYKELQRRVDDTNEKARKLLNKWMNRAALKDGVFTESYLIKLANLYTDYVNSLSALKKQDIFYSDLLSDSTRQLYFQDSVSQLKYSKGPSIEKRSKDIRYVLLWHNLIQKHKGKQVIPLISYYELKPFEIKKLSNDVRMGLRNYFGISQDKMLLDKETEKSKETILIVFDDNISGGATLSDICSKLQSIGYNYIIPITFGKMKEQYNIGQTPISRPENNTFNY